MGTSAREIVELDARHFRILLATEKDPSKRATIERLLAEHEPMLAALVKRERVTKPFDLHCGRIHAVNSRWRIGYARGRGRR
jgi:hypothetical protein